MSSDFAELSILSKDEVESDNLAVEPLKETTVVQTRLSNQITLHPGSGMMAAIDFEVAEQGMRDRADLVERAVSQYLGRQKHNEVLLSEMDVVYVSASGRKMRLSRVGLRTNPSGPTEIVHSELARPEGSPPKIFREIFQRAN